MRNAAQMAFQFQGQSPSKVCTLHKRPIHPSSSHNSSNNGADSLQSPNIVAPATGNQEPLIPRSSDHSSTRENYQVSTLTATANETSTSATSSFAREKALRSQYSSNTNTDRGAETHDTDIKSLEPDPSPLPRDNEKTPEDVTLPQTTVTGDSLLRQWQDILNLYAETMKMRIRNSERRNHSQNLRLEFMQHAEETVQKLQDNSPQTVSEPGPLPDALAHLRILFSSVRDAEAEVYSSDEELVINEHKLSKVTEAVFENEESPLAMLDALRENEIDIRGMDVASSPSAYTSDNVDFQALDGEAEKVDQKIKQMNLLEDLYNSIRNRRIAAEKAHFSVELQGSSSPTEHDERVKDLKERETAIQNAMKIAQDELDHLRDVPDPPVEDLMFLDDISPDY